MITLSLSDKCHNGELWGNVVETFLSEIYVISDVDPFDQMQNYLRQFNVVEWKENILIFANEEYLTTFLLRFS